MGPIKRPDHIPEEEWVDPLPMWKRVMAVVRYGCLILFQVLLALQLDGYIAAPWTIIFIPIYLWELIALRRKIIVANVNIVTHDELELAIGKKIIDCTPDEREDVHRRFIVVPAKSGSIYDAACRIRDEAKMDIVRILARITFTVLLVLNLDLGNEWSWWLVFLPIFAMAFCIVMSAFRAFVETQSEAIKKDPELFGLDPVHDEEKGSSTPYAKMDEGKEGDQPEPLTDEEKEELKNNVAQAAYRASGTCFSQCFFIIILCVLIGKIEGAGYSSLVIISPFLAAGGIILCCLACTIFCISEVDENAGMTEFDAVVNRAAAASGYGATEGYTPPTTQQKDTSDNGKRDSNAGEAVGTSESKPPPKSTWDPEKGEIWQNASVDDEEKAAETELKEVKPAPVEDAQPMTIEGNPSITTVTSSECDLD